MSASGSSPRPATISAIGAATTLLLPEKNIEMSNVPNGSFRSPLTLAELVGYDRPGDTITLLGYTV